jgi:hypothetical protein
VIRYGATHSGRLQEKTTANILQGHRLLSNVEVGLQASGSSFTQLSQKMPLTRNFESGEIIQNSGDRCLEPEARCLKPEA